MQRTRTLLMALLLTPLAALHAADPAAGQLREVILDGRLKPGGSLAEAHWASLAMQTTARKDRFTISSFLTRSDLTAVPVVRCAIVLLALFVACSAIAADEFERTIQPVLRQYCIHCHSTKLKEGELDLEQFANLQIAAGQPKIWEHVLEQLANGEMPPKDEPQLPVELRSQLTTSLQKMLDQWALANAGDPGDVVLRRLSNVEYTYTLRDLTGVASLDPAKEFPVDGAAGEGFSNAGAALVMSPSLLTKYLDAAKAVAEHAVLTPDGIRFSAYTTRRDQTDELLARIQAFYRQFTDDGGGTVVDLHGIKFNSNQGGRLEVEKYLTATLAERELLASGAKSIEEVAGERNLNAKYLGALWQTLSADGADDGLLLAELQARWRETESTDLKALLAEIERAQKELWKFNAIGHIGRDGGPTRWMEPVGKIEGPLSEFMNLFPPALCYARIVPVDEVVTLALFHREDDHLRRLMLDDRQAAELDRLWDELYFVSREPLKLVVAFEQISEFATQDRPDLVKAFKPLAKPINDRADAFRKRLQDSEPVHVNAVVEFADQAWRRPLTGREQQALRDLYQTLRTKDVDHEEAVRLLLARVLTSPAFLYRGEQAGAGSKSTPVSDWEMATRLSYFLWSSAPDEELRAVAASGKLHSNEVLAAQTRRMLQDDRVRRLATEFGCQWLHIRDLETLNEKSERHFPTFVGLRDEMQEEAVRFLMDMFQTDRSVLSLLDADHSFMNAALAEHYGIDLPNSKLPSDEWQRVDGLRARGRGGMLGFAATLAKQSGASRTSPILRGNWISEVVLGEKLPRPPKDVPILPEEAPKGLTERQLIERHSSDPSCARCHERIDHFGFALEGFDAIGRARSKDAAGLPIDTLAKLPGGGELNGMDGLRSHLLEQRRDDFLRQFCRKLLGYALGRSVQLSDKPLLDDLLVQLKANDYRVGTAIERIVLSPQFREIRGRE